MKPLSVYASILLIEYIGLGLVIGAAIRIKTRETWPKSLTAGLLWWRLIPQLFCRR